MNVAGRIVERQLQAGRTINKLQLQKLLYIADVASAEMWAQRAFDEPVVALPYGPAVSIVTNQYRDTTDKSHQITAAIGDTTVPTEVDQVIDWVLERFGTWSHARLINYVKRAGNPWKTVIDSKGAGPYSVIDTLDSQIWFGKVGLEPEHSELPPEVSDAIERSDLDALLRLI